MAKRYPLNYIIIGKRIDGIDIHNDYSDDSLANFVLLAIQEHNIIIVVNHPELAKKLDGLGLRYIKREKITEIEVIDFYTSLNYYDN